jgi:hypothetical protein
VEGYAKLGRNVRTRNTSAITIRAIRGRQQSIPIEPTTTSTTRCLSSESQHWEPQGDPWATTEPSQTLALCRLIQGSTRAHVKRGGADTLGLSCSLSTMEFSSQQRPSRVSSCTRPFILHPTAVSQAAALQIFYVISAAASVSPFHLQRLLRPAQSAVQLEVPGDLHRRRTNKVFVQ